MVEKLRELEEKLLILESNRELFSIVERLKMAVSIRNAALNDSQLAESCESDAELSEKRGEIFERSKTFINATIEAILTDNPDFPNNENLLVDNYSESQNELLNIVVNELGNTLSDNAFSDFMSAIPEWNSHRDTLRTIEEHCSKNRYTVLLMGEYQTGKTTTLDALCDGRHIGKIGVGSATSAVPVSVSYCEKEDIKVGRKTDEELKGILYGLTEHLDGFRENFDLKDQKSRAHWLKELEEFRLSKDCPKDVRPLAVCSFILKHYGTPELDYALNEIKKVSDAPKYTYFPEKLNDRWSKGGASAFDVKESVFVFISHIDCHIDSPTLKRLGCTLIDCPGLFHNKYDSEVTTQIMSKVHAILYLLPYQKSIGEDVCESLYKIQRDFRDVHRKLFIANNLSSKMDNAFVQDNMSEIQRLFGKDKDVTYYDAHLAYLGMFKHSQGNGQLMSEDITHFCRPIERTNPILGTKQVIRFATFEEAWEYHTKGYNDIPEKTSDALIQASGINQLIDNLRSFIEANEAYTVIFTDGINKMYHGLTQVRNGLNSKFIEPYRLGSQEVSRKWHEREEKAIEFDKNANAIIHGHIFEKRNNIDTLPARLSDDIYGKLFTESIYDELSRRIAATIYENKYDVFILLKDEAELKEFISPLIEKEVTDIVESRLNYWNSMMVNGSDTSFKHIFEPEMEVLESRLLKEWHQIHSNDKDFVNRMNDFLSIPRDSAVFTIKCREKQSANVAIKAKDIMPELFAEILVIAQGIALIIASYLVFLVGSALASGTVTAVLGGITSPLLLMGAIILLLGGGIAIIWKGTEAIKMEFVNRIGKKIRKQLDDQGIESKFKKMIVSEINRLMRSFEETLHVDFEKLNNEKDIATSRSDEAVEADCFRAAHIIANINAQLKVYGSFKGKHVRHEQA